MRSCILLIFLFLYTYSHSFAGHQITIDGLFEDWQAVQLMISDSSGDGVMEDFADLKVTNDNNFLFLKFSFNDGEHLLQDLNTIRLYIDTDNNTQTGVQKHGIGAELVWCFGCREGTYYSPGGSTTIRQANIVLRSAPTITSQEFEMALGLHSVPMTLGFTQTPDTIAIVFESSDDSDQMPDTPSGVHYKIDRTIVEMPDPIPLEREQEDHIRIMTYNTLAGGLLNDNRQKYFQRIILTLDPDIMAFQEQSNAELVTSLIRDWFQERDMFGVEMGNSNIVVSRFPILNQALITGSGRTMAVLLQTEMVLGSNILILNSHLACCTNNDSRQHDSDEITMVLRGWRAGAGPFPLADNTPIVHLGDFNLVGDAQQLRTLTMGDIVDEETFGDDFLPDWDNTPLTDLFSRQTSILMGYTWRNDFETFSPGKLDYILYTDHVIEPGNHYVLNTLSMSADELDTYDLLTDDTNLASDHLPRIMDIASVVPTSIEDMGNIPSEFDLDQNYPNPFNPRTTIKYSVRAYDHAPQHVNLSIYNLIGQKVATLVSGNQEAGTYQVEWDASGYSSGIYLYKLFVGKETTVRKMVLMK